MCVFCKIINNEISSHKVYEDGKTLAFLDIKPVNAGHILVVPKAHYENIEAAPVEELGGLMKTVKLIGGLLKEKLGVAGYNVYENNDPVSGQIIPHLHFHVIPRHGGDGLKLWPGRDYRDGEAEEILKKLSS